jgi:hypothetical protein
MRRYDEPSDHTILRNRAQHGGADPGAGGGLATVGGQPTPKLIAGHLSSDEIEAVIEWIRLTEAALVDREPTIGWSDLDRRFRAVNGHCRSAIVWTLKRRSWPREARRIVQEAVIRARRWISRRRAHLNPLSSPFASFRSAVLKPSVNQA